MMLPDVCSPQYSTYCFGVCSCAPLQPDPVLERPGKGLQKRDASRPVQSATDLDEQPKPVYIQSAAEEPGSVLLAEEQPKPVYIHSAERFRSNHLPDEQAEPVCNTTYIQNHQAPRCGTAVHPNVIHNEDQAVNPDGGLLSCSFIWSSVWHHPMLQSNLDTHTCEVHRVYIHCYCMHLVHSSVCVKSVPDSLSGPWGQWTAV